jgi:hypothetical protein
MRIGTQFGAVILLAVLALSGAAVARPRAPLPQQQPSPETVAKLIGQLGAADAASRQQASDRLEELGGPVLPALRQAVAGKAEGEAKSRLELLVARIEHNLLKAEEKRWQALDASRRGLKDRLVTIMTRAPTLSDQQRASAIYLLAVGRPPTDDEVKLAQKQLAETNGRAAGALSLARSLVQGKDFCAEVAVFNVRLTKVKTDLAAEKELVKRLHRLNSDEIQKMTADVAATLNKAVKADGPLIDLAFLLVLSRFPKANDTDQASAHLKKAGRLQGTEDMLWALMNTREFLQPE